MKLFAFFLAIMVLLQSVTPCNDTALGWDNAKAKTELLQASHQQESSKSDVCSPFCQCACCAGFSINHFIASVSSIPVRTPKAQPADLPSETIDIVLPVWQPPQLLV